MLVVLLVRQAALSIGSNQYDMFNLSIPLLRSPYAVSSSWKIFDHVDVEVDVFEDPPRSIRHETERVGKTPGGAIIDEVLIHDSYPIY